MHESNILVFDVAFSMAAHGHFPIALTVFLRIVLVRGGVGRGGGGDSGGSSARDGHSSRS